jgi:uncharacterized protein (TIGR01244 family)
MTLLRAFLLAAAVSSAAVVLSAKLTTVPTAASQTERAPATLAPGVAVRDQISLADVLRIKSAGFNTIIDLRPDGEAPDQPPSAAVEAAADAAGLRFAYIPTPQGAIPDATVERLAEALAASHQPVLLYCRSGNRAARVWALAEASRADGADATNIALAVRAAGQKIDDLTPQIAARIAARKRA